MYSKIRNIIFNILVTVNLTISAANAWPADNKIEKNVRPNQSVKLFKMYLYQPDRGCSYLPPPQSTSEGEKLGKVTTNVGKEKITKDKSACGAEFEASYLEWIYTAGSDAGVDNFKLYHHNGVSFLPVNVKVTISGNAAQSSNANSFPKPTVTNNKNTNQNGQIVKNLPLPSNPFFEKMKIGSVFTFFSANLITNKNKEFHYTISDKNSDEFSTSGGTVYNKKFERVKSGNWRHNTRSCDGFIYPLSLGAVEKFNHDSVFVKDNVNSPRYFNCERKIIGKKTVVVEGKAYDGWIIENIHTSTWNNGDDSIYKWVGVFSEDIGFWTEVTITEQVAGRMTQSLKEILIKFEIPSPKYQIKTTMCAGSCENVADNQKATLIDSKLFETKSECEKSLDEFKNGPAIPVPVPTSFSYSCVEVK